MSQARPGIASDHYYVPLPLPLQIWIRDSLKLRLALFTRVNVNMGELFKYIKALRSAGK